MPYHICGCYYFDSTSQERHYLPQVRLDAHTTIISTASRTVLRQRFTNPSQKTLEEIRYAFPLYDGVSVVDFICEVGDRTIYGIVKEKAEARVTYEAAKSRGENAALLEQLPDAADVFTTSVSNIPADASVVVSITYIQELKHDAEVDGVRLTVPWSIAPRYGSYPGKLMKQTAVDESQGFSLTVDMLTGDGCPINKILSPTHPIEVSLGSLSTSKNEEEASASKASATLALKKAQLGKDFVLQIVTKDIGVPQAILETHATLPNQRALMTTFVPKFNLKPQKPEIIFLADRSGSMSGSIDTLISALKVFLKSIPVGCLFNICSFGSSYSFLWPSSQIYSQDTLAEAIEHVNDFDSGFGGTETLRALKGCFEVRKKDMQTELMLLTDGDIWDQVTLFKYLNNETETGDVRVFPLGIGEGVSSALIEGVARAGHGFAQMVGRNEKLDSKIVRMLKGALTPHINDYRLEVKYEDNSLEAIQESSRIHVRFENEGSDQKTASQPISLYNPDAVEEHPKDNESDDIFAGLPKLRRPSILQAPQQIPALFPFNRTCIYLLLSPAAADAKPRSVLLKGTSPQGPLELEIPVEVSTTPGQMIHQLAARKAIQELEEKGGWVAQVVTEGESPGETVLIGERYPTKATLLQQREAVRLGVEFQVGGKYCSFVAVEANETEVMRMRQHTISTCVKKVSGEDIAEWDIVEDASYFPLLSQGTQNTTARGPSQGARSFGRIPANPINLVVNCRYTKSGKAQMRPGLSAAAPVTDTIQYGTKHLLRASHRSPVLPHGVASMPIAESQCPKIKRRDSDVFLDSFPPRPKPRVLRHKEECHEEECEESDDDMGFGLFDDGSPLPSSGAAQGNFLAWHRATDAGEDEEYRAAPDSKATRSGSESEDDTFPQNLPPTRELRGNLEDSEILNKIIAQQSFEGSWSSVDPWLQEKMGIKSDVIHEAVDGLVASLDALDRGKAVIVLSTAIIVSYLEQKLAHEEETWELIVEKAKSWLEDNLDETSLRTIWPKAGVIVQG